MLYQKEHLRQTFFIVTLVTIVTLLAMIMISTYADDAAAQEPSGDSTPVPFSEEMLEAFGLSANSIGATAAISVNMVVNKTANVATVASGGNVTYTIAITNSGPHSASIVFFKDNYPIGQMSAVKFDFSQPATSDEHVPPTWLFDGPIPAGHKAVVTVTGKLEGAFGTTVVNTAEVMAWGETNPNNNTSSASVRIGSGSGGSTILYLPMVFKAPPRVLLVSDNFSSSSGWTSADDSNCQRGYNDNQYRMWARKDKTCFTPAPLKINGTSTEYTYAEYQVFAQISAGDGDFDYGMYINGAGGDNYYLLRIKPHSNCGWRLIRRKSGTETTLGSGGCSGSGINTSSPWNNTFAIRHDHNGLISVFVNDQANNNKTPLFTVNDSNQLTGRGAGLFVEAASNKDITVRFDDFQIYSVPQ